MDALVNDFLNGNLSLAQARARRHTLDAIAAAFETFYSPHKALKTALYLKKRGSFQAAVDAE